MEGGYRLNFLQANITNAKLVSNSIVNKNTRLEESSSFQQFLYPLMTSDNFNEDSKKDLTNSPFEMLTSLSEIAYEQLTLLNNVSDDAKDEVYYESVNYLLSIISSLNQIQDFSKIENKNSTQTESPLNVMKLINTLDQIMLVMKEKWSSNEQVKEENPLDKVLKILDAKLDSASNSLKIIGESKWFEISLKHTTIAESNTQKINTQNFVPVTIQAEQLHVPKPVVVQLSLNTASEQTAKSQLLEQMEQLILKSRVQTINGKQNLMIRLTPEHLGTVHIKLQHLDSGLNARIIAHSAAAAKLLEGSLLSLKANLQASNVQVDKIEVVFQDSTKTIQQEKEHNHNGQQPNKQHQQQEENQPQSFQELLEVELDTSEVGDNQ